MFLSFRWLSIVAVAFFLNTIALAGRVRGPNYYHEYAWDPSADSSEIEKPKSVSRNKFRFLAPVPAQVAGGMLVGQYEYYDELYRPNDGDPYHLAVHMMGATYIPRYAEGSPRWFVSMARYGNFSQAPMIENVFGLNLEHTPFFFKPTDTADISSYLALYVRKFPFGFKYLPILLYKCDLKDGWYFEMNMPTMVYVGYHTPDFAWSFEFDAYLNAINYPWETPDVDSGWIDGYTTNFVLGVKRQIYGHFYATFYAGAQASKYWYSTRDHASIYEIQTRYMPVVMGGVETYFDLH